MDFGNRVKQLLKDKGLSSKEFALKIDEHPTALSSMLSGNRKPKAEFILKLVEAFPEVDLNWLFRGETTRNNELREDEVSYSTPNTPEVLIEKIEENLRSLKAQLAQK